MAKAYKRLRRQRTERRLKNQSFMEPSKRPLTGKRKKSFIRSLFSKDASEPRRAVAESPIRRASPSRKVRSHSLADWSRKSVALLRSHHSQPKLPPRCGEMLSETDI